MRRGLVWAGVVLAATVLVLGIRFAFDIEFESVLWIEASIFAATAGVLYSVYRSDPASAGWRRSLQVVLVCSFVLGALRSAIWASGQAVTLANAVVFGLGVTAWLVWRYRRRLRRAASAQLPTTSEDSLEETARES
jgi:hypothetical protein